MTDSVGSSILSIHATRISDRTTQTDPRSSHLTASWEYPFPRGVGQILHSPGVCSYAASPKEQEASQSGLAEGPLAGGPERQWPMLAEEFIRAPRKQWPVS